jgi:peptide/nickel transport system substrate-binding protein
MIFDRRNFLQSLSALVGAALYPILGAAEPVGDLATQPFARFDTREKPVRGGTLRVAAPAYIGLMNPNRWPVNDWVTMGLIHQKLVITDGAYRPSVCFVAESIVRDGPTTALLTLREDIRFHDGTPLNAQAIVQQMEWIRAPSNATFTAGWLSNLDRLEVVSEREVRWYFKDTWAAFEGMLANVPGYALSPTALNSDARLFEIAAPKGVGPYMVEAASPGNFLKLKRNPDYWLGKVLGRPDMPYHDGVLVSVIPDPSVRLANFRAGKLDLLLLQKSQYTLMKKDPAFNVYVGPVNATVGYRINAVRGPCSDIRVRKAIRHAIDVKGLIHGTQHGLGRLASGLYPADHWAHNPALQPASYNPSLAKALLKQAGFGNGLTLRGYVGLDFESVELAEAVSHMLREIGIEWQVDATAPVPADARRKSLDWDLSTGGWPYIYEPDLAMTGLYHPKGSFAEGRKDSPARTAAIEAARSELDLEKRQAMYRSLERECNDECFDVWLWWEESATAFQKWLRGYDHQGILTHKEAWMQTHPTWFAKGLPG